MLTPLQDRCFIKQTQRDAFTALTWGFDWRLAGRQVEGVFACRVRGRTGVGEQRLVALPFPLATHFATSLQCPDYFCHVGRATCPTCSRGLAASGRSRTLCRSVWCRRATVARLQHSAFWGDRVGVRGVCINLQPPADLSELMLGTESW